MSPTRLRVLHLTKGLDRGGAEVLIAAALVSGDPDRVCYEVAFARSDMAGLVADLRGAGHAVHDLGARSDLDLRWAWRLRRLLAGGRYDVVHLHLPYSAGIGRLVARTLPRRRRPRLVYTEHSLHQRNTAVARALRYLTGHLDDVSIAVSESNRAALPAHLRRRTRVVVHGVDARRLVLCRGPEEVRRSLGIPDGDALVLCVANLTAQKGHADLLAAAGLLRHRGSPTSFLVAGDGPLAQELTVRRDEAGLAGSFHYLGQRADVVDLMAAADVLVLPSVWECMPVVVMEAFTLGLPVVATQTGDLPRVVVPGVNGLLVPANDPPALARALERVLGDPALQAALSEGAVKSSARFDARRTAEEIESIYEQVLAR